MNSSSSDHRSLLEEPLRKASKKPAKSSWIGKLAIFAVLSIGSIAGCIVLVRSTVAWVSASPARNAVVPATSTSHSVPTDEDFRMRKQRNEAYLAAAKQEDAAFIADRQRRLWIEQTRQKPDHRDAFAQWKTQVERLEAKVAEMSTQEDSYNEDGSVLPESILWHQQQRLEELRADAPPSY
ncbi:hypothetical protein [Rhodopirellula sp. P2]|uniref:hypothetical protein n=1 Tax=Rhodopirellula sp. P2 TaxID=2127060 RepID=UPI002368A1BE|nr:hypothetical protein [Rhodopirellula sp. P2]WDQ15335.1 hypothetical protein PSR62_17015 [Rhodopirellula sp. P2]